MSIIHDALKKIQQGQSQKPNETPYLYSSTPEPEEKKASETIEYLSPKKNKAKSVLAYLCAIAFFLGALAFCYENLHKTFPQINEYAKTWIFKLIHKKELPENTKKLPKTLVPLAKITVNPSGPAKTPAPNSLSASTGMTSATSPSGISSTSMANTPATLNIHGVMSNGSSNVVLIDDQVYQVGDEVDGVKIVEINLNSITVNNNGTVEKIRVKD